MAILPDQPGLKVEIYVNGSPLKEYDDDGDLKPKTVTKYIEAVSGAQFKIKYSFHEPFPSKHDITAKVWVDGKVLNNTLIHKRDIFHKSGYTCSGARSYLGGKCFSSAFKFAELEIDRDNSYLLSAGQKLKLSSMGCISIAFEFVRITGRIKKPHDHVRIFPTETKKFPEKTLQIAAFTHCGSLGEAKRIKARMWTSSVVDPKAPPFATFNFKYRSIAALKDLRVIPRTPSPVPPEERPAEELNQQELLALVNRYREREAAATVNIKSETKVKNDFKRQHDHNDDEVTFVSERQKNKPKLPQPNDEIIELD